MAKLLSSHTDAPKRYYIRSYHGGYISLLDSSNGTIYSVQTDSVDEAATLLNFSDDEWHVWLTEEGVS